MTKRRNVKKEMIHTYYCTKCKRRHREGSKIYNKHREEYAKFGRYQPTKLKRYLPKATLEEEFFIADHWNNYFELKDPLRSSLTDNWGITKTMKIFRSVKKKGFMVDDGYGDYVIAPKAYNVMEDNGFRDIASGGGDSPFKNYPQKTINKMYK